MSGVTSLIFCMTVVRSSSEIYVNSSSSSPSSDLLLRRVRSDTPSNLAMLAQRKCSLLRKSSWLLYISKRGWPHSPLWETGHWYLGEPSQLDINFLQFPSLITLEYPPEIFADQPFHDNSTIDNQTINNNGDGVANISHAFDCIFQIVQLDVVLTISVLAEASNLC